MIKPLENIKVIELASFVAGPSCAKILADQGATVVKIEAMNGDPWRIQGMSCTHRGELENPIYDVYNAGKHSICMNIKAPGASKALYRMLENADVFVTNMRQKSLVKAGLDGKTLSEKFPRLIHATITGYGPEGPDANLPGFDNIAYWSRSGFLLDMGLKSGVGTEEVSPAYPIMAPTGVGDTITGVALYGAIATALYQRTVTGKGSCVTSSLYNNAIWSMCSMVIRGQEKYGDVFPKNRLEDGPVNCPYKCADGKWIAVTILEYDRYAPTFYKIVGVADTFEKMGLNNRDDIYGNRTEVFSIIEAAMMQKDSAQWLSEFRAADITSCIMNHFSDVEKDEQAWANGYLEKMKMRNGQETAMPRSPIRFMEHSLPSFPVSALPGENTQEVFELFGFTAEEIDALKTNGAIK